METRQKLYDLLGSLPSRQASLTWSVDDTRTENGVEISHITLLCNGREPVPCWFTKPAAAKGKLPAMLFAHSHGGDYTIGKDEFLFGRSYMQSPGYGIALAKQGIAALCPDAWCFGQRRHAHTEGELFRSLLLRGASLWGAMIYDHLRALDYLCSREDVDASRVGVMGMSMGSTAAWWLAALDTRLKLCVDICCLSDLEVMEAEKSLCEHGVYYFVPGLLNHFTTADICALIAPRAHLALAGTRDSLTPKAGLDRIEAALNETYAACGAPENWQLCRFDTPHFETPTMRRQVLEYLEERL